VHTLVETVAEVPTPGVLLRVVEVLALPFAAQLDVALTAAQYTPAGWREEGASRFI
jgi:hypothetical protein